MEDLFSYIANDARCLSAIEDLEDGMDTLKWLGEHLKLYMNVTNCPKGLPRIVNCNYEGTKYEGILKFAPFISRRIMNMRIHSLILQKELKIKGIRK